MWWIWEYIKGFFAFIWDAVTADVSLTAFLAVALFVIYFLFSSNRSVNVDAEMQLEKQKKEIEDKRREFDKRLSHEWRTGFRISFFLTSILWVFSIVISGYLQYCFCDIFRNPVEFFAGLTQSQEIKKTQESTKQYGLHIKTIPESSKIRILNISPAYKDGIQLPPGDYMAEVKAVGFQTKYECIIVKDQNVQKTIRLLK